jgi:retron-type reverse transcriptase
MSTDYSEIFELLIGKHLRDTIIYKYTSKKETHEYTPFRHDIKNEAEKILAEYMRKYISPINLTYLIYNEYE